VQLLAREPVPFIMMKNQNTSHSNKDYVSQDWLIKSLVPALKAARDDRNFTQVLPIRALDRYLLMGVTPQASRPRKSRKTLIFHEMPAG